MNEIQMKRSVFRSTFKNITELLLLIAQTHIRILLLLYFTCFQETIELLMDSLHMLVTRMAKKSRTWYYNWHHNTTCPVSNFYVL